MKIIYPKSKTKTHVGVTAPSSGLGTDAFNRRFNLVKDQYLKNGFNLTEGKCLRENVLSTSASAKLRAADFMQMWSNPEIDLIQPPWGGELLIDILEHIEFEQLKKTPTWLMGYSDISTLLFAITTMTGIASVHGTNFMDSIDGQDDLTKNSKNFLKISDREELLQKSSSFWQKSFTKFEENLSTTFNLTEKTVWKELRGKELSFSGRIIGGCFDTLRNLVGTRYGNIVQFYNNFCLDDGMILYLENCDEKPNDLYRGLMGMKYAGYFDDLNGVIFGRNNAQDIGKFSYLNAIEKVFSDYSYPVVLDADIGHKPPQMSLVNGSLATVLLQGNQASLVQKFV